MPEVRRLLQSDLDIAARTVAGEARSEPFEDQVDVAQVITNRWRSNVGQFRRDDTLATACLRHVQFSCWNMGDPNFAYMMNLTPTSRDYRTAMAAVCEALEGSLDRTLGALHYKVIGFPASWADGHTPCYVNDAHEFYNDVA